MLAGCLVFGVVARLPMLLVVGWGALGVAVVLGFCAVDFAAVEPAHCGWIRQEPAPVPDDVSFLIPVLNAATQSRSTSPSFCIFFVTWVFSFDFRLMVLCPVVCVVFCEHTSLDWTQPLLPISEVDMEGGI